MAEVKEEVKAEVAAETKPPTPAKEKTPAKAKPVKEPVEKKVRANPLLIPPVHALLPTRHHKHHRQSSPIKRATSDLPQIDLPGCGGRAAV
jgi:hypothetical protein